MTKKICKDCKYFGDVREDERYHNCVHTSNGVKGEWSSCLKFKKRKIRDIIYSITYTDDPAHQHYTYKGIMYALKRCVKGITKEATRNNGSSDFTLKIQAFKFMDKEAYKSGE